MTTVVLIIFIFTYLGVALGDIPGLAIDRTGIALIGAIGIALTKIMSSGELIAAVDFSVLILLYALMLISAQFRLAGFYTRIVLKIVVYFQRPVVFLALLMAVSAVFSALLANDIVCLAFTPIVCHAAIQQQKNPFPFLIGLAMASNIGSAATIIGNPQNILIAQSGRLDFLKFFLFCSVPSLIALIGAFLIIFFLYRNNFQHKSQTGSTNFIDEFPEYNAHQSRKGLLIIFLLIVGFLLPVDRSLIAVSLAALLLCSRYMHTRRILALIDWHLLTLFASLFIVVAAGEKIGIPQKILAFMAAIGFPLDNLFHLTIVSSFISNLVSNVPAAMMLIKFLPSGNVQHWYVTALATTFAGNLFTIGSIANLIVIESAKQFGIKISFKEHARAGVPVFIFSVLVILGWILIT